ncbi:MAG: DUF4375 domain-containing protein [Candidatus Binatus sp.]|uniref:DMP19 family protein n=1 Tax=Candidatus Binatus sp. TaxID=2811406 RepID=UPI003BB04DE3
MTKLPFLQSYSGQTAEQLLSLEGEYRIDSLVLVFEEALGKKAYRDGASALSAEENVILAIEALEREVNNGGYSQFFENSSQEYAPIIVPALIRIGCPKTAEITQTAIESLHLPDLSVEAIEAVVAANEMNIEVLNDCDNSYFGTGEDIAGQLFAFIKKNRDAISL